MLYSWLYDNCLTVNPDKTTYVIFKDPRKQIAYNRPLYFGQGPIKLVRETKYLGIIIDSSLSFISKIDAIKRKIIRYVGVLQRIKHFVPVNARLSMYYVFMSIYYIFTVNCAILT
jgi:hypothetical protein